jgi:CheY-like chemotaxis protein
MPEMGGIEMGQKIRATAWGKDIPIIYITNMMVNADVRAAISSLNRSVCLDKSKVSIPDIIEIAVKSATTGLASNS